MVNTYPQFTDTFKNKKNVWFFFLVFNVALKREKKQNNAFKNLELFCFLSQKISQLIN